MSLATMAMLGALGALGIASAGEAVCLYGRSRRFFPDERVRLGVELAFIFIVYALLSRELMFRQWGLLLLAGAWAGLLVALDGGRRSPRLSEEGAMRPGIPTGLRLVKRGMLRTFLLFLLSGPAFVVFAYPHPPYFTVFDAVGGGLCAIGLLGLVARGGPRIRLQPQKRLFDMSFWGGVYLVACSVPSGFLTLFAPVFYARSLRARDPEA